MTCTLCPLHQGVKNVCLPTEGPSRARLLVVGTAPDDVDDDAGKVFAGREGKLLRAALDNLGVEYCLTNVVRCRPPDNRKPLASEWGACRTYLDQDLAAMPNLEVVVLLGPTTAKAWGLKGQFSEMLGVPVASTFRVDSLPREGRGPGTGGVRATEVRDIHAPGGGDSGTATPLPEAHQRRPVESTGSRDTLAVHVPHVGELVLAGVIPIQSPAYVLRNNTYLSTWQSHWDVVKGLLTPKEDPTITIGARILDHVEEP